MKPTSREILGTILLSASTYYAGQTLSSAAEAASPPSGGLSWAATARDGVSTTWQATQYITNAATGLVTAKPHQYIEIGSGLNYFDAVTGKYQESRDIIELISDGGAAALHGPAKLFVKAN